MFARSNERTYRISPFNDGYAGRGPPFTRLHRPCKIEKVRKCTEKSKTRDLDCWTLTNPTVQPDIDECAIEAEEFRVET